jgi:hypothetical protein
MTVTFSILLGFVLFLSGVFATIGYMVLRMLRNDAWDDSNITNALRLIAHMTVHPQDFGEMYYLTEKEKTILDANTLDPKKPFWYINKDELSEVVDSRPPEE